MRKRIAALLATFALAFCLPICTPAAFAASAFDQGGSSMAAAGIESDVTYNAGNLFAVMHPVSNTDIENDLYWAGQTLDANKVNVGTSGHGSILAAGQSITLKNVKVADSVRAAAQDIMIDYAQISNNITVAAQNISLGNDVKANGVYASARTLSISGSYQGGLLVGETVSFDGTRIQTVATQHKRKNRGHGRHHDLHDHGLYPCCQPEHPRLDRHGFHRRPAGDRAGVFRRHGMHGSDGQPAVCAVRRHGPERLHGVHRCRRLRLQLAGRAARGIHRGPDLHRAVADQRA